MGDFRSKSQLSVEKPTNHTYGETALERVAFKQRGISNTYKSSITLGETNKNMSPRSIDPTKSCLDLN